SDHGQVETEPFKHRDGRTLGELLAGQLPDHEVEEFKGGRHGPASGTARGRLVVTYSGGLAHLYFADRPGRLSLDELDRDFPRLAEMVASLDRVALVLAAGPDGGWLLHGEGRMPLRGEDAAQLLGRYEDDPSLLAEQLARLNSFQRSGDLIVFGAFRGDRQVNFEH